MSKNSPSFDAEKELPLMQALEAFSASHSGIVLTYDNLTPAGLTYLLDMGLKQSLGDIASVNRPKITGITSKGLAYTADDVWTEKKRIDEATRLGISYDMTLEDRKALADAWIADANLTKFAKILNGELTVSASGERGDALQREMYAIVETSITNFIRAQNLKLAKSDQVAIPKGPAMKAAIKEKLSNPAVYEKVKALAEPKLAFTVDDF